MLEDFRANVLKRWCDSPSARETGKESSLGLRVKTMVTVDWRPPNRRFCSEKKLWVRVLVVTAVTKFSNFFGNFISQMNTFVWQLVLLPLSCCNSKGIPLSKFGLWSKMAARFISHFESPADIWFNQRIKFSNGWQNHHFIMKGIIHFMCMLVYIYIYNDRYNEERLYKWTNISQYIEDLLCSDLNLSPILYHLYIPHVLYLLYYTPASSQARWTN